MEKIKAWSLEMIRKYRLFSSLVISFILNIVFIGLLYLLLIVIRPSNIQGPGLFMLPFLPGVITETSVHYVGYVYKVCEEKVPRVEYVACMPANTSSECLAHRDYLRRFHECREANELWDPDIGAGVFNVLFYWIVVYFVLVVRAKKKS